MYIARSKQFDKQYRKLPGKLKMRFKERLELFLEDMRHPALRVHELSGKYKGYRSFNVTGDIRAVYTFHDNDTMYLAAIGTHSELYR